jgi:uncharacterized protein (TIGR02646 family)
MIHLPSDPPSEPLQAALEALASQLLPETVERFEQIKHASALWDSKTNTTAGIATFESVRDWLRKLTLGGLACHYCEYGEPKDIEHIYPKSHFPRLTFEWRNYLLSCKQCNMGHKLAKFAVFDGEGNVSKLRQNQEPISEEGVFIHPREDKPDDLILVELTSFEYVILDEQGSRNCKKAQFTLDTLALNRRDWLLEARKNTFKNLLNSFQLLLSYLELPTMEALKEQIHAPDFKWNRSLEQIREDLIENCRIEIATLAQPSMWTAIKLQHTEYPAWKRVFEQLPQALQW